MFLAVCSVGDGACIVQWLLVNCGLGGCDGGIVPGRPFHCHDRVLANPPKQ